MNVFDRLGILRTIFPAKAAAADAGVRWTRAARANPELMADVIRMGGLLTLTPDEYANGVPLGAPIDPCRQSYDKGRADLAKQLCALMGLNRTELQSLMEDYDA